MGAPLPLKCVPLDCPHAPRAVGNEVQLLQQHAEPAVVRGVPGCGDEGDRGGGGGGRG